jgi:hypothetical protein
MPLCDATEPARLVGWSPLTDVVVIQFAQAEAGGVIDRNHHMSTPR